MPNTNPAQTQRPKPLRYTSESSKMTSVKDSLASVHRELYMHAWRLTRSNVKAEDLVQDTIERALRFEDRFEPGSNLRAWLHHMMFNVFISTCRQRKRESKAMDVLRQDPCAWTAMQRSVESDGQLSPATKRAMDTLPPQFRETLRLVDLEELPYRDAARKLGIPVGTVMSRLHRGRRLLAEALSANSCMRQAA